jgi:Cys-tRNA(Pro)/Cys-tRNA(Cys) deacylase
LARLTPEEVTEIFGVEVGAVGPITQQENVQVIFDARVPATETLFCGIGRADRTLEIHLADLVQLTQGRILPLANDQA